MERNIKKGNGSKTNTSIERQWDLSHIKCSVPVQAFHLRLSPCSPDVGASHDR